MIVTGETAYRADGGKGRYLSSCLLPTAAAPSPRPPHTAPEEHSATTGTFSFLNLLCHVSTAMCQLPRVNCMPGPTNSNAVFCHVPYAAHLLQSCRVTRWSLDWGSSSLPAWYRYVNPTATTSNYQQLPAMSPPCRAPL